jgi:CrcB protein
MSVLDLGLVTFGGAIGATLRYVICMAQLSVTNWSGWTGVLMANLLGCLIVGLAAGSAGGGAWTHAFVITGLCGALTTFSALALDITVLIRIGAWRAVSWCLGLSLLGGIPLVVLGQSLGHLWIGVPA